jgi:hypothetical protein
MLRSVAASGISGLIKMTSLSKPRLGAIAAMASVLVAGSAGGAQTKSPPPAMPHADSDIAVRAPVVAPQQVAELGRTLDVGDLVFIRIGAYPFRKVADATGTWTNHVGIVLDVSGREPVIGESRFPFSGTTPLSRFVARSAGRRVAVMRLPVPLTNAQRTAIVTAAAQRERVFYDTGFDIHSDRQFCSRYVREVLQQGAGVNVGEVENFQTLLARSPQADIGFWRVWYVGSIPWQRETVTPASVMHSPGLMTVFDGVAV